MRNYACWLLALSFVLSLAGTSEACDQCIANKKASQQASEGRMRHVGGSLGTGRYEGVGYSTVSADHAIRSCC